MYKDFSLLDNDEFTDQSKLLVSNISIILIRMVQPCSVSWVRLQVVHKFFKRLKLKKERYVSKAKKKKSVAFGYLFNI